MIFGVDGTGAFGDKTYAAEMADSFVSQICRLPGGRYWRGPDGIDTPLGGPNPRVVAEVIRASVAPASRPRIAMPAGVRLPTIFAPAAAAHRTDLTDKVFLTGYSRGAATVLDVAVWLNGFGIPVEAMFLFDSVTRSPFLRAKVVPANVKYCYHAMRSPIAGSRKSFGNSGEVREGAGHHEAEPIFLTTHGGMGGTPWGEKGLVKPGPGPGVKDLMRSAVNPMGGPSFVTPRQIAEAMVRDEPHKYGDKIYEDGPDWRFTTITVAQERYGMKLVRDWMWKRLNDHGLFP